jgi:hypothetical protein
MAETLPAAVRSDPRTGSTWSRFLTAATLALVAAGLLWRATRYLLQFPIWGDEAMLCLNFLEQDYAGFLTGKLNNSQVAPLLFLWGELTARHLLGASDLAMRLLPFLAGAGGLLIFWRLCRRELEPFAALLAVGFLAVAYYPVRHSCEAKPYASDLFVAAALLALAAAWLRRPERKGPLAALALVVPFAVLASYPAVLIAGAVSLALLPAAWRQPGWQTRALFAAYNGMMLAGFVASCLLVGGQQLRAEGGRTGAFMEYYWAGDFPPAEPLPLLRWLVAAHTGDVFAYPFGAGHGGSTLTTLLCLVGGWSLWRSGRRPLLVLCVAPFGLALVAAFLHRYPYGSSARLAQYLAPGVCLLAGTGAAAVIARLCPSASQRQRCGVLVCAALLLSCAVGLVLNCVRPYKTPGERWAREVVAEAFARIPPQDKVVVLNGRDGLKPTLRWYLARHEGRFTWAGNWDEVPAIQGGQRLWCLHYWQQPSPSAALPDRVGAGKERWTLLAYRTTTQPGDCPEAPIDHWVLSCWGHGAPGKGPASPPLIQ